MSLQDMIADDDIIHLIIEIAEKLDTAKLENKYDSLGQNSYHPKMMIEILFFAYAQGIFSSRKIEEMLRYDIRFMYIAGMHRPSFNRICRFRRENLEEIHDCFVQIVKFCQDLGLVSLKSISIDGSKMPASASKKKLKDRKTIAKEFSAIQDEVTRLLKHAQKVDDAEDEECLDAPADIQLQQLNERRQELERAKAILDADSRQQRINLTDPDCREMQNTGPGYNVQAAVDSTYQIIVAADVVSDPNDVGQLIPMIEQIESNTDSTGHSKQINADAGYTSGRNYKHLAEEKPHIDAYIPTQDTFKPKPLFNKSNFSFIPENESCTCPLGQPMQTLSTEIRRGVRNVKFKGTVCPTCPAKFLCTQSQYRQVRMTLADDVVRTMNDKMKTRAGKAAMKERRQTVEPVFGQMKSQLGFIQFHLRGLKKVKGEFSLLCAAFNIKKLHRFLKSGSFAGVLSLKTSFQTRFVHLFEVFFGFLSKNQRNWLIQQA